MANTIKYKGFTVEISSIDSDWTWTDTLTDAAFTNGVPINFIQFNPGAADDKCTIYEDNITDGPVSFYAKCDGDDDMKRAYYHGTRMKPILDYSAGTFSTGSTVIIQLSKEASH